MTSTAAATAKVLADAGIERVFGLPGGEVLVLMDELRRQPGVVLTTLGPGAANLMLRSG